MNTFEQLNSDKVETAINPEEGQGKILSSEELKALTEEGMAEMEKQEKILKEVEARQILKDARNLAELREKMFGGATNPEVGKNPESKEDSWERIKKDWKRFYQEIFDIEADFSQVEIPESEKNFKLPILMPKGLTSRQIIDRCREHFMVADTISGPVVGDFEEKIVSERSCSLKPYAVLIQEFAEAGESELKDLSADDIKAAGLETMTLKERLIYGLKYFLENGKHLDSRSTTICAGSRLPDGQVPTITFLDGKVMVILADSDMRAEDCGARLVKTDAEKVGINHGMAT